VLGRKDEAPAGDQGPMNFSQQPHQILDVMQRERAVGEIEPHFGQFEVL